MNIFQKITSRIRRQPAIYFVLKDSDNPSWGVATIYHFSRMLSKKGFESYVLHEKKPFRLSWFDENPRVRYQDDPELVIKPSDWVVVPEFLAFKPEIKALNGRKIVLVQNAFLITDPESKETHYGRAGYEKALTVMPHLQEVIEKYHGMSAEIIPYFVAPYFFPKLLKPFSHRKNQIVIYPKKKMKDYPILKNILMESVQSRPGWSVVELQGKSHRETAEIFCESKFFLNVNCYEAFNTSVSEAMASGCICFCYEAFGGKDFLKNRQNAYVFQNNDVYPMLTEFFKVLDHLPTLEADLSQMQARAHQDMLTYQQERTDKCLQWVFQEILKR
jgi:hypothetical protein